MCVLVRVCVRVRVRLCEVGEWSFRNEARAHPLDAAHRHWSIAWRGCWCDPQSAVGVDAEVGRDIDDPCGHGTIDRPRQQCGREMMCATRVAEGHVEDTLGRVGCAHDAAQEDAALYLTKHAGEFTIPIERSEGTGETRIVGSAYASAESRATLRFGFGFRLFFVCVRCLMRSFSATAGRPSP